MTELILSFEKYERPGCKKADIGGVYDFLEDSITIYLTNIAHSIWWFVPNAMHLFKSEYVQWVENAVGDLVADAIWHEYMHKTIDKVTGYMSSDRQHYAIEMIEGWRHKEECAYLRDPPDSRSIWTRSKHRFLNWYMRLLRDYYPRFHRWAWMLTHR